MVVRANQTQPCFHSIRPPFWKFCDLPWSFGVGRREAADDRSCLCLLSQPDSGLAGADGDAAAALICGLETNLILQLPQTFRLKNNLAPQLRRAQITSVPFPVLFFECRLWRLLTFV